MAIFRPEEKRAASVRLAEGRGYEVLAVPMLETRPYEDPNFARFLRRLKERGIEVVVFTSTIGVSHAFARADGTMGREAFRTALNRARVFAIGPATRAALAEVGVPAEVPREHSSRGLVEHFRAEGIAAKRVALLRSRQGGPDLRRGLSALGCDVTEVAVYDVGPPGDVTAVKAFFEHVVRGRIDVYAFLSSMTVHNFLDLAASLGVEADARAALSRATVAAIGKPTREALEREGIRVRVTALQGAFGSLLDALDAWRNV